VPTLRQELNKTLPEPGAGAEPQVLTASDPNTPLDQLGQAVPAEQGRGTQLDRFFDPTDVETYTQNIIEARNRPNILRALIQNDVPDNLQSTPLYQSVEDSLVTQMSEAQTVGDVQSAVATAQSSIDALTSISNPVADVDATTEIEPTPVEAEPTLEPAVIERSADPGNYVNLSADNPVLEGLTAGQTCNATSYQFCSACTTPSLRTPPLSPERRTGRAVFFIQRRQSHLRADLELDTKSACFSKSHLSQ
jgi:hypothetical protein